MFKLLTEEGRKKVEREYILRRSIVMLVALTIICLIGIIGLFPSYILSKSRQNEVTERVRIMGNTELGQDEEDLKGWLEGANEKLALLDPNLDKDKPSVFIEEVLENKPIGIKINFFSWRMMEGDFELYVTGVASDRQTLLAFESQIRNSAYFSDISLPVSNLARDRDIDFQIKFVWVTPEI